VNQRHSQSNALGQNETCGNHRRQENPVLEQSQRDDHRDWERRRGLIDGKTAKQIEQLGKDCDNAKHACREQPHEHCAVDALPQSGHSVPRLRQVVPLQDDAGPSSTVRRMDEHCEGDQARQQQCGQQAQ
jgi:hypothetical protein